ncbi:2-acylglycerophosphoethanolamine acyltransferase [Legionella birminghamensis]|uniref:2-acylglycerophosphoethanolamine acyltransferase n=1 Tax=Legionella birminghamensis TaxID=28083 RepID=A0A378I8K2_9GAMM|nr:MFS transporter [Legionella birminghamensis]KTC74676.1 2-acylglycerophosphoethanolamine acyltransferase [Legionella birminghamensis]STX31479.1 2-acylglycerophosphoethanolamine acyltransferase [Legionella birminghamensis]
MRWRELLAKRSFLPLFVTQFCGALNDNVFKLSMLTLISYHLSTSQNQSEHFQALAGALFTIPFFLFSATAGQLADRYDKALISRVVKLLEIVLMILGSVALYRGSIILLMLTLTGMGIHSTFFGPIKYAILPDHLPKNQLLDATALIEASTFLAILLGTTLGALSIGNTSSKVHFAVFLINITAIIGFLFSLFIPRAPACTASFKVDWNVWRATKNMLRDVIHNAKVLPAILAISWFWLIGAVILTKLPDYTHYTLRADTTVFALFLTLFSIGIALGSMAISRFLAGKITIQFVPLTMLLMTLFAADLYWATPALSSQLPLQTLIQFMLKIQNWRIICDFFFFSVCGGLFVVPLYTYLQISCDEGQRARTIAANNIFGALSMVIGSLLIMVLLQFNINIASIFIILAVLNALVAAAFWATLIYSNRKLGLQAG